jgi:hypothetical protein
LRGDLAQSILMQSIGFCGKVECGRDPAVLHGSSVLRLSRYGSAESEELHSNQD